MTTPLNRRAELVHADMHPGDPDVDGTPRFAFAGAAKREKPIWTREQFGPWKCDVRVTPITGMRRGYPVLEVNVQWERGPALDESLGPTPRGGMAASDSYYVDREAADLQLDGRQAVELAIALAQWAADLLADGTKPALPVMARTLRQRIK